MNLYKLTGIILLTVVVLLVIWDVFAFIEGEDSTISVVITDFAFHSIPFNVLVGILIGHWFWPAEGSK